jgi:DNA-binding CsgD family transcriptional regulator
MTKNVLATKIDNTIAELASFADTLPGVVIIHNLEGAVVWMSKRGANLLGITQQEVVNIPASEYYQKYFNGEDAKDYVPKILSLLERNNDGELCTYFQQVRYNGQVNWTWHMSSTKIWMRDDERQPMLTITMSFPIDAMHHMAAKASRLLEENNFLRSNFTLYAALSPREREVLKLMALGKSSPETATELFISTGTVETHRKNIRQKLNTTSYYELGQYARAFDLI